TMVGIEENGFPLHEARRWAIDRFAPGFVRTGPRAPVLLGTRGVTRADVEGDFAGRGAVFAPPREAPPVRKDAGIEGIGLKSAAVFVAGPESKDFPRFRRSREDFPAWSRDQAGDLRGGGGSDVREAIVAFHLNDGAFIAGAQEQFSCGRLVDGEDEVIA